MLPAHKFGIVIVLKGHLVLTHENLHFAFLVLDGSRRFQLHGLNETGPETQFLLQRTVLSGQILNILLLFEVLLLEVGQPALSLMQFLLESVIWLNGRVLFDELAASALVLLLEGSLEVTELLVFGHKGVPQHVHLYLLLSDLLLVQLLESHHSVVDLLDLLVLGLD